MVTSKSVGAYGHPLSLTKHAFFVLFMYRGHADVWGHVDTSFVWQSILSLCCVCTGASKHHPNIWGHPNILVFLSNSLTLAKIGSHHLHKKNFTHSFWLNLMMAAILNSAMLDSDTAILDSDTLISSLRFTQKHSPSTLTLTQTNSIWLKLIHSHSTWWWQPSWILQSWILPSWIQPS